MKNKRYIRLSKKMKAYCDCKYDCSACKYYKHCFHRYIICPKLDSLRYIQLRLKGMHIKK